MRYLFYIYEINIYAEVAKKKKEKRDKSRCKWWEGREKGEGKGEGCILLRKDGDKWKKLIRIGYNTQN